MHQNRTKISRTRVRLYTAIVFLIGMVFVLLAPYSTGIPLHEWASFLIIIPLLIHIIIDWKWIVTFTKRIFKKQPGQTRFNYYWDWLLFILMTVMVVSGVLISEAALPAMGITMEIDPFWTTIHIITSRFLMMMLGVHIAMHWNWIISALKPSPVRASAQDMDRKRKIGENSLSPLKSTIIPILIIVLAAALVTLAVLPLADANWAEGFRTAGSAASDEARARPRGIQTTLTDLYWGAIIMGIPALITLGILRLGKHLRK